MANPVSVPCPKDVWTKVIENKTSGNVYIQVATNVHTRDFPRVYFARKDTGEDAPVDGSIAVAAMAECTTLVLENSVASDLYIMPTVEDQNVLVDA